MINQAALLSRIQKFSRTDPALYEVLRALINNDARRAAPIIQQVETATQNTGNGAITSINTKADGTGFTIIYSDGTMTTINFPTSAVAAGAGVVAIQAASPTNPNAGSFWYDT